jgi:iron(III) transport system substrate-binding protein
MKTPNHLRLLGTALALTSLALVAVACGDDDDTEATPTSAPTSAATTAAAGSPTAAPSATETATGVSGELTVYSGRSEELIGPLLEQFEEDTGVDVQVRYGSTPEMAAAILEEGDNSPADLYIGQDAGSVGMLASEGLFTPIPEDILALVPDSYRGDEGNWVGLSGRVRVVVYNTDTHSEETLPDSILDYTDPAWSGKIGWAPTNASFQSFVTALRVHDGEEAARAWVEGIVANDPVAYPGNADVVQAVASGEVEVGFVNHYYLGRFLEEEGEGFGARNYYFTNGDIGGLMNVAGAGVLETAENPEAALALIEYMLQPEAQEYFAQETFEFPLIEGVSPSADFIPELATLTPVDIELTDLGDVEATVTMLQETGALE